MSDRKALFFCSSYYGIDPKYNQAARDTVRAACLAGYDIVSGGTVKGTMADVVEEAHRCGARSYGILPRFMTGLEHPLLDSVQWVDSMSERKEKMREGTSVAIALPGGIGTLDELAETYCLSKMNLYAGKVIAYNLDGFYDSLKKLLDHYVETGMLDTDSRKKIYFPTTVQELEKLL